MSQFQDIARRLTAAATAALSDKGTYMLYAGEDGKLISKLWTGEAFSSEELVASQIRPRSTAAYLLTPSTKFIAAISSDNTLRALRYDDDEEEWADEEIPRFAVHPEGHVSAIPTGEKSAIVVYQDAAAGELVYLDDAWNAIPIPAAPIAGSPIHAAALENGLHVFYVSAEDSRVHDAVLTHEGAWEDSTLEPAYAFTSAEQPKRFLVAPTLKDGALSAEVIVLTTQGALLMLSGKEGGAKSVLGTVTDEGQYVASTSAECAPWFGPGFWAPPPYYGGPCHGWGGPGPGWYQPPPKVHVWGNGRGKGRTYDVRGGNSVSVNVDGDGEVRVWTSGKGKVKVYEYGDDDDDDKTKNGGNAKGGDKPTYDNRDKGGAKGNSDTTINGDGQTVEVDADGVHVRTKGKGNTVKVHPAGDDKGDKGTKDKKDENIPKGDKVRNEDR